MSPLRRLLSFLGLRRYVHPEHVVWLDDCLLLVASREPTPAGRPVAASVRRHGRTEAVTAHSSVDSGDWWVLVLELPAEARADLGHSEVSVRSGRLRLSLDASALAAAQSSAVHAGESLVAADPAAREHMLDLLWTTCSGRLDGPDGAALAANLRILRHALRLRLPVREISGEEPFSVHVDRVLGVDDRSFWIKGWISDPKGVVTSASAVSPEGCRVDLLSGAFRYQRRDVQQLYARAGQVTGEKHGLINFVQLDVPSSLAGGWIIEARSETGGGVEAEAPVAVRDPGTVRESILGDTNADEPRSFEVMERHAHPALTRLQDRERATISIDSVTQHGTPPASPNVSVIIPLYGRIDFMQHQFAQFAHDREVQESDLIYVLDEPQLAADMHRHAAELHEFYGFPFRVVVVSRHAGFSGANNLAASVAHGRLLALVNSDVFPDRPGWIGTMAAFYDATPNIGALGPKLLYEDGSLQHAGLLFEREAESHLWGNQHYYKGFSRDFPAANVTRTVPAVTGACLMIERALYEQLGGLSDAFIQGGYDDSDLCLRLIEQGRSNWYLPQVELYHLEDQSFPPEQRELVTRYNMWLQTHLWGDRIEELMRSQSTQDPRVGETLTGVG
jgi:GT2 family glycosyltransferase